MRSLLIGAAVLFAISCAEDASSPSPVPSPSVAEAEDSVQEPAIIVADDLRSKQEALLNQYFAVYKAKDVDGMLALFDDEIMGALYPATVFGHGIEAARGGIAGDYASRPHAWADMPHRYRIAKDKWLAFGTSVDGENRAPLWILFDLDDAGEKIEATYTQIAFAGFIEGISVEEPTAGMESAWDQLFSALRVEDFGAGASYLASDAALYAYPPHEIENHQPVITGASDVASVLTFKWGEKAWRDDTFVSQYMQFVFVAIPGEGFDRVALFTFGADPSSLDYEKIVRVDVMGPSGG